MKIALKNGVTYNEFWELTPYELELIIEAYQDKKQLELENQLTACWYSEYLSRVKKLPSLQSELDKIRVKRQVEMTDETMLNQVKVLNMLYGGKIT